MGYPSNACNQFKSGKTIKFQHLSYKMFFSLEGSYSKSNFNLSSHFLSNTLQNRGEKM